MKTLMYLKYLFLGLIVWSVIGCKSAQDLQHTSLRSLPSSYEGSADSSTTASVHWKEFFSDPLLVALVDTALQNNWDVMSAFQRIKMAQSDVLLSKGAMKPQVDAAVFAAQRKFGLYTMDGAGNITTEIKDDEIVPTHLRDYFPGLHTSWEIDLWGKLRNQKRAALAQFMASSAGRNFVITNLIAQVADGYYELTALDNELLIIDETIKLQENAFALVKVQKDAGVANALAVKQFEAQLLNSQSMKVEIQQQVIEKENEINFLLGRYPQPIRRDSLLISSNVPAQIKAGVPSDILQHRPDVRQAEFELLAAKADVKSAKAFFYPSLNITGSLGFQAYKPNLLFMTPESYAYSLLGNLSAPLLNRSAIRAQFDRANARQLDALYNYQKTIVNGFIEVYNRLVGIQNLERIFALKSQEAEAFSESVETSTELFRTGRATYLEVIVSQQSALQAKLELVDVKKRQFNYAVNLYKALGGGWR